VIGDTADVTFRSVFGTDGELNRRLWARVPENPVVRAGMGDWAQDFVAPSSVLQSGNDVRLYVEGSAHGVEQIGVFTCRADAVGTGPWCPHPDNPIVRVGDAGFDKGSVFDPVIVRFQDRYLLYYSATESDAHAYAESLPRQAGSGTQPVGETIGLATSPHGLDFVKHGEPVFRPLPLRHRARRRRVPVLRARRRRGVPDWARHVA
jgi:hypothetical protein